MLKVSKMADYAVVVLAALSREDNVRVSAFDIARQTRLPEPTVAKVLKKLARHDIVMSYRGANGGYVLMKPIQEINIADIITAIDGPISLTSCVSASVDPCSYSKTCTMKGRWDGVNGAITQALSNVSLADMVER